MSTRERSTDWQVVAAVALIAVGGVLFLNRLGGPWWEMLRRAFGFAFDVAWPVALIALGILLLVSARRGGLPSLGSGDKRLYRSRSDRMVGGVLAGLAAYLGTDPTWVRIAYVLLSVFTGFGAGVLVYIIAMIVIPEEPAAAAQPVSWPQAGQAAPAPPVPAAPASPTAPPVPPAPGHDAPPPPPPPAG